MHYKTPALKQLFQYIKEQYPNYINQLLPLEGKIASIDLSAHIFTENTYRQTIELFTGDSIELTWNIDQVIQYSKSHTDKIFTCSIWNLYYDYEISFPDFENNPVAQRVYASLKDGKVYTHKIPYIIIARVPFSNGFSIIDGNHRFYEALLSNQLFVSCFVIADDECFPFLQPESQKYISVIKEVEKIVMNII